MGQLAHRGVGVIGAKWWWVVWSPMVLRSLGPMCGGDLQIVLPKRNTASVVGTSEVVGTLNHYKMVKKSCALRDNGDVKTF